MKATSSLTAFGFASLTMLGCGQAKTNLSFYVDPPPDGDSSCIGVAGFDVAVSTAGRSAASGPLPNAAPVLDGANCRLNQPFSLEELDLDSPASIVVTARDGAGVVRAQATGHVDNLHGGPVHVQLQATTMPPAPVLVVYRAPLLGGALLSDVVRFTLATTAKGRSTLVDIAPGDYFNVEPAAYGVPANLAPGGTDAGELITADVTTAQGPLPRVRLNAFWNPAGYYEAR